MLIGVNMSWYCFSSDHTIESPTEISQVVTLDLINLDEAHFQTNI